MPKIHPDAVLEVLQSRSPRSMHLGEICAQLGVKKSRTPKVATLLDHLIASGAVREMPGRRFRMTPEKKRPRRAPEMTPQDSWKKKKKSGGGGGHRERGPRQDERRPRWDDRAGRYGGPPAVRVRVEGVLSRHPRGFGFLAAEDGEPDVFIPPNALGPALHGDRVEAMAKTSARGREGEVVGILKRREPRITARFCENQGESWLEPDDLRLPRTLEIVDTIPKGIRRGDAVEAHMVSFPQFADDIATARVTRRLGAQGVARVEVEKLKIRDNIIEEFDAPVRREAEALPPSVPKHEKDEREDLRHLDFVTIDPPDARDHDDALYCERAADGATRLIVAIADVSHYVRPGTAVDGAAQDRCTSIYLPDRAIPMLPKEISSGLASLVPNKDRLCLAVEMLISKKGKVRDYRFLEGVIRSRARLTYTDAARVLGLTEEGPKRKAAVQRLPMIEMLYALSKVLRQKRLKRGALDFDLPEGRIKLDEETGEPLSSYQSRKDPGIREAYRIVEEMMLITNEVVARDLTTRGAPGVYRIHGKPDAGKLALFCRVAQSLGHNIDPYEAEDPRQLARFLERIEGTQSATVLRMLLLRAMQQASYDTRADIGHFGLAARDYLHFTSPIRRYPDLEVHRVVRTLIRREPLDAALVRPRLRKMSAASSRLERRAMQVERDVVDVYRAIIMRAHLGDVFTGMITSLDPNGMRVQLSDPFVDVTIPADRLDDDYELDELGVRLRGVGTGHVYELGERIRVEILDANPQAREVVGVPLGKAARDDEHVERAPRPKRKKRGDAPAADASKERKKRGGTRRGDAAAPRGARATAPAKREARGPRPSAPDDGNAKAKKAEAHAARTAAAESAKASVGDERAAAKKRAPKKSAPKKAAPKKAADKKAAPKKAAAKKTAPKKTAAKRAPTKKATAKKAAPKKATAKKQASRKAPTKKRAAKKAAQHQGDAGAPPRTRPSRAKKTRG